jgi:hypothetical protein
VLKASKYARSLKIQRVLQPFINYKMLARAKEGKVKKGGAYCLHSYFVARLLLHSLIIYRASLRPYK